MPTADIALSPRWRAFEGPAVTLGLIAGLELLRLSGGDTPGLRALLPLSLLYYAFRGSRAAAVASAALVWGYLVFAFAQPNQSFFNPAENPARTALWGAALPVLALLLRWLGERNGAQLRLLRDREARLAAITDHMADGLIIIDERGTVELFNPAAERLFGYTAAEVLGRNVRLLMPEPDASAHDGYLRRYLETGKPHIIGAARQVVAQRKDGTVFPMEFTVNELRLGDRLRFIGSIRDVSERQRIEEELAFQRRVLEAQSEAAIDGILVVARNRRWVRHNRRFAEMWSLPAAITANGDSAPALDAALPQVVDPDEFRAKILYLSEHPDEESYDEVRLKDGRIFERYSAPVRSPGGEPLGRVWYYRDVTERRRAEATVQRLATILENSPDLVGIADPQGRVQYVNPAGRRMLGLSDGDDVIGEPFSRFLPAWAYEVIVGEGIPAAVRDGAWRGETAVLGPNGVQIPVSQVVVAHKDKDGSVEFLSTVIRDLSERARAEQQLRDTLTQLQEQYRAADRAQSESRAVLDAAGDAMMLIAPDRRVLSLNRTFTEFFGITADMAEGYSFHDFRDLAERVIADAGQFLARLAGAAADPQRQFTDLLVQKWPQQRELALYSTPVHTAAGDHIGRLYVFRDVTHERAVDRMKNEFVSLVSHELRTPLTSIKGYVDLVLAGEAGPISDDQREFLEIVKNNADRLVTIINDLLDVARIESGRIELLRAPLDLVQLVRRTAASLRPQIEAKGQQITLDLPDHASLVLADSTRISQVLLNLLSNAHKYTPAGGQITITVRQEGGVLRTSVQDTGIGLTPDEQAQLFTRFFRARNRTTQEVGGTGLGLAITRSLVEMHGGEITVTSAPGHGSTFSFTLPLVAPFERSDGGRPPPA